ncbi:MAG TPA: carboxypeptidase regulatory-like domain-containing protein [Thermoanaerobaculia bacterium]|nr:carboxypeptidase regulatory-like domain-containing protein [Thermoanaerobaculia bacterium]
MNQKKTLSAALIAILIAVSGIALAGPQARIVGTVTTTKGEPIEGATVTITTPAFGKFKVVLTSDKDGKWGTILNDSTIAYDYLIEAKGYIPIKQNKKVGIGSEGTLDVQLLTADQAVEKGLVKEVVDPYTLAFNGAVEKFQAGDLDGAIEGAKKATELGPDKAGAWDMATKVAAARKDWDLVIQWGEKALSIEPDNGSLFGALMEAYKAKGDKAKAAEYEKKFIAANPDKPEILYNQAVDLYNKGDFKGADPILRKVLEGAPEYANAHFLLGMSCVNLNKIPDMKKHLEEYIRLDPKGKEVATAKEMLEAFK